MIQTWLHTYAITITHFMLPYIICIRNPRGGNFKLYRHIWALLIISFVYVDIKGENIVRRQLTLVRYNVNNVNEYFINFEKIIKNIVSIELVIIKKASYKVFYIPQSYRDTVICLLSLVLLYSLWLRLQWYLTGMSTCMLEDSMTMILLLQNGNTDKDLDKIRKSKRPKN